MSEDTDNEVIVKEELQSDADLDLRGKARVSIDVMKKLKLVSGDVIEIHGTQNAAAIVWPGLNTDTGLSIIRIDSNIRANAGTAVDEKVKISKADAEYAQKIVVKIPPRVNIAGGGEQWLLKILKGRLVKEGQIYRFVLFGDVNFIENSIMISISRVIPKGIVYVSDETEIELKVGPDKVDEIPHVPISEERIDDLKNFLKEPRIGIIDPSIDSLNLFNQAFTHGSFAGYEASYQRLEFLGDRVLNLIVAEYLFDSFNRNTEGEMTKRMEFTKNENLQLCVEKTGIIAKKIIQMGSGTAITPKIVADILEAFIGALYVDQGLKITKKIVLNYLADEIDNFKPDQNYIGKLKEYCEDHNLEKPRYIPIEKKGTDNSQSYFVHIEINNQSYGEGEDRKEKEAEQKAARSALIKLGLLSEVS